MPIVDVEYHYRAEAPVRNRRPRRALVRDRIPVTIPEVGDADAPLLATVEGTDNARKYDGRPSLCDPREIRAHAGGTVRPFEWPEGIVPGPTGLPALARPPEEEDSPWWQDDPHLFTGFGDRAVRREELRWRGEVRTDIDAARAHVAERAARMCLVGGRLYVPCPMPVLAVRRLTEFGENRIELVVRVSPPADHLAERLFSLHDEATATAFAGRLAARLGIPFERYGRFALAPGAELPYDGLIDGGRALCDQIARGIAEREIFASRPSDTDSDARFPGPAGRLLSALPNGRDGSPQAIREVMETLLLLRDDHRPGARSRPTYLDGVLARPLDVVLDAYRELDRERLIESDADAEALFGSLAPGR